MPNFRYSQILVTHKQKKDINSIKSIDSIDVQFLAYSPHDSPKKNDLPSRPIHDTRQKRQLRNGAPAFCGRPCVAPPVVQSL